MKPEVPHSDFRTGKSFKAVGREWFVGQCNITWTETKMWIESQGGGWRNPTRAELKLLFHSVGKSSAIGDDWVWAEKEDSSSAWHIDFDDGYESSISIDDRFYSYRAIAVR